MTPPKTGAADNMATAKQTSAPTRATADAPARETECRPPRRPPTVLASERNERNNKPPASEPRAEGERLWKVLEVLMEETLRADDFMGRQFLQGWGECRADGVRGVPRDRGEHLQRPALA